MVKCCLAPVCDDEGSEGREAIAPVQGAIGVGGEGAGQGRQGGEGGGAGEGVGGGEGAPLGRWRYASPTG